MNGLTSKTLPRGITPAKNTASRAVGREAGAGYFDEVSQVISAGEPSTIALHGATEDEQFD